MGNKIIMYLTWALVCLCVVGTIWVIIEPIIWWNEVRLYIRLFLFMFAVNTFGVLRLYNSIVQNTRFSIRLRESLLKFIAAIPGLERAMKSLSSTMSNTKVSVDALKKGVDDNTEKIEKLTERINKSK